MKNIEICVLNAEAISDAEMMMVAMARLTQRSHKIGNMADFIELLNKSYTQDTVRSMIALPHPTIQKFGIINIAIVGASRRFLAQITRHQNEVKFMSGSLQYSDYTGSAAFCVPYEVTRMDREREMCAELEDGYYTRNYLNSCHASYLDYEKAIGQGLDNDAAGYMMPQGMRNVLVISATPYQWKHMIEQRTCNRNTLETQYVMLLCLEVLQGLDEAFFGRCGAPCMFNRGCPEGKFSCGNIVEHTTATEFLNNRFKYIRDVSKCTICGATAEYDAEAGHTVCASCYAQLLREGRIC